MFRHRLTYARNIRGARCQSDVHEVLLSLLMVAVCVATFEVRRTQDRLPCLHPATSLGVTVNSTAESGLHELLLAIVLRHTLLPAGQKS